MKKLTFLFLGMGRPTVRWGEFTHSPLGPMRTMGVAHNIQGCKLGYKVKYSQGT